MFPMVLPGGDDGRVFLAVFFSEHEQVMFGSFLGRGFINEFQIAHKLFLIFAGHILQGIADLMDDAKLDFRFRKQRADGFRKAFQSVNTGNQNIFHATLAQVIQYAQPELRPFAFIDVKTKDILAPMPVNARAVDF